MIQKISGCLQPMHLLRDPNLLRLLGVIQKRN